uniref:Uncharacterized protein n=1 Tax=Rhizophora mucronata TaxID=61149 RepID=A0A2P2PYK6_RHIMU
MSNFTSFLILFFYYLLSTFL